MEQHNKIETFIYDISLYHGISLYRGLNMNLKVLHYPRLDTILNVEKIIRGAKEPLSKNEIDRRLPKKIMRPTLNLILNYLSDSGKIVILKDGIIWIYKEDISKTLKKKLEKGITVM